MNIPSQVQGIFELYLNRILGAFFFNVEAITVLPVYFLVLWTPVLKYQEKANLSSFLLVLSKLLKCFKYGLLNGLTSEILMQRFATR